jgi:DNA-directed RNA polymerase specialized sigma24 family protein
MLSVDPEVLFARHEHGAFPIRVVTPPRVGVRGVFEVLSPVTNVVIARYSSTRNLLTAITRDPNHGLNFDQYFGRRQDHPSFLLPKGGSALDIFAPPVVVTSSPIVLAGDRIVAAPAPRKVMAVSVLRDGLGIDLEARGHEVRKLLFAGFGTRITRSGYDPEEVLQEVYRGILARNRGKCPFDVRKSSFGHYVHMVCECVLNNYHRRESRRREVEQVGMIAPSAMQDDAGATGTVDAASVADRMVASTGDAGGHDYAMSEAIRRLASHVDKKRAAGLTIDSMSVQIAAQLAAGKNRREIAADFGISQARVTTAINSLREHVSDWM